MWRQRPTSLIRSVAQRVVPLVPGTIRTTILRSCRLAPMRRWFLSGNASHWDRWYATADVASLEANPREQRKFELTLEAVGREPIGRALEIGCGPGSSAPCSLGGARSSLALIFSTVAVAAANARLAAISNARAEVGSLPDHVPEGPFDVVVCSDVLYYLSAADLRAALARIQSVLAPGGAFIAVHHRHDIGLPSGGDQVHLQLRDQLGPLHEADLGDEVFAIDRFRRPATGIGPIKAEAGPRSKARTTVWGLVVAIVSAAQSVGADGLVALA